jgi:hypothetical protein
MTKQFEELLIAALSKQKRKSNSEQVKCTLIGAVCVNKTYYDDLMLELDITIVPLGIPNKNSEGIPNSEKENVIQSASLMPVRANFQQGFLKGHANAQSVGSVKEVYTEGNIIKSRAFLWRSYNADLCEYLEDIGTSYASWEVLFSGSYLAEGTTWLTGVVVAGVALVEDPAYGLLTPAQVLR